MQVFDGFRAAMTADRAQFFLDVPSGPFFGFNRPGMKASQGLIESWYQQGMAAGFKNAYDCIKVRWSTSFVNILLHLVYERDNVQMSSSRMLFPPSSTANNDIS